MLLQELQLIESSTLTENYGNLNAIEKKFHDAIKIPHQVWVPHDSEQGTVQVSRLKTIKGLGQNSTIEKIPFKTASAPYKLLDAENVTERPWGMVITAGQTQFAIIMKYYDSKERKFIVGFDSNAISSTFGDSAEQLLADIADNFGEKASSSPRRGGSSSKSVPLKIKELNVERGITGAKTAAFTTLLLKVAKTAGVTLELLVIWPDKQGPAKNKERSNARYGSIPTPRDKQGWALVDWNKKAKESLQARLDRYKSSKAVGIDSTEDLINAINEHGYLDKINIAGFTYNQYDSNIRLDRLLKPTGYDASHVTYKRSDDSPAYAKYEQDRSAIRKEFSAPEQANERDERLKELRASIPPSKIKIMLKLVKGSIVPGEIKFDDSMF